MTRRPVVFRTLDPGILPPRRRSRWPGIVLGLLVLLAIGLLDLRSAGAQADPDRYVPTSRGALRGWHADLVAEHFPPEQVPTALRVMACESKGDPGATGTLGERGLFQIRPELWQYLADLLFWPGASLYDPEVNVATAAAIWKVLGWSAWSCAR